LACRADSYRPIVSFSALFARPVILAQWAEVALGSTCPRVWVMLVELLHSRWQGIEAVGNAGISG
jgi:hypothetical protein